MHATPARALEVAGGLIPAIGYVRVSKAREEMISPELQKEAITQWAARKGRIIIDWVEDLDMSGRTWNRRILGVIARIERAEAAEVVVWKYSRFGRERTGQALNLARVERAGGALQSATEDVDAGTSTGRFTRAMLMEIAAFESDRTSEVWHETWAWRIERGLPARGGPRFGYKLLGRLPNPLGVGTVRDPSATEVYVPDTDLADGHALELYRRAFEVYVSGADGRGRPMGYRGIADMWNRAGLTTTRGGAWHQTAVSRLMRSGWAAGYLHVHDPECEREHDPTGQRICSNRIHLPGAHEAIIDIDTWEDFRERSEHVKRSHRGVRAAFHTYSGLIWCGHCGASHGGSAKDGDVYYVCSRNTRARQCGIRAMRGSVLDPSIRGMIRRWATSIEEAAAEAAEEAAAEGRTLVPAEAPIAPEVVAGQRAREEIERIDRRLSRLTDMHLDEIITREEYMHKRGELLAERARHADVAASAPEPPTRRRSTEELVAVALGLDEEWETLPAPRRRELVRVLVERIDVFRESRTKAWVTVRLHGGHTETHDASPDLSLNTRAYRDRLAAAKAEIT